MASDVLSVTTPATSLVHGSQAPKVELLHAGGNTLPQNGKVTAVPAAAPQPAAIQKPIAASTAAEQEAAQPKADLAAQLATLNKFLNDSGRPAQFRASANNRQIEEINPATGEVIGVYPAAIFAELAKSVGISGALIDRHA